MSSSCLIEYLYKDEIVVAVEDLDDDTHMKRSSLHLYMCFLHLFNLTFSVSWAKIGGTVYKRGATLVIENDLLPRFGKVIDIVVYNVDRCVFVSIFCHQLFLFSFPFV